MSKSVRYNTSKLTVDLGNVTTSFYSDADINVGKALLAEEQYGLEGLLTEQTWFNQFDGLSIDLDQAFAFLAVGNCDGIFLPATKGEM